MDTTTEAQICFKIQKILVLFYLYYQNNHSLEVGHFPNLTIYSVVTDIRASSPHRHIQTPIHALLAALLSTPPRLSVQYSQHPFQFGILLRQEHQTPLSFTRSGEQSERSHSLHLPQRPSIPPSIEFRVAFPLFSLLSPSPRALLRFSRDSRWVPRIPKGKLRPRSRHLRGTPISRRPHDQATSFHDLPLHTEFQEQFEFEFELEEWFGLCFVEFEEHSTVVSRKYSFSIVIRVPTIGLSVYF